MGPMISFFVFVVSGSSCQLGESAVGRCSYILGVVLGVCSRRCWYYYHKFIYLCA